MSQTQKATFQWRTMYLQFVKQFDPAVKDPGLTKIRINRSYGTLVVTEKHILDIRETNGAKEVVKAIFKSENRFVVMTTLEGHVAGSIYYFGN